MEEWVGMMRSSFSFDSVVFWSFFESGLNSDYDISPLFNGRKAMDSNSQNGESSKSHQT